MRGGTVGPIVGCGRGGAGYRASAVGEGSVDLPLIRDAGIIGIGPIGGDVAIVIFEVVDAPRSER